MNNKLLSLMCITSLLCAKTQTDPLPETLPNSLMIEKNPPKKQGTMEIYNDCALLMSYFPFTVEPGIQQQHIPDLSAAIRDDSIEVMLSEKDTKHLYLQDYHIEKNNTNKAIQLTINNKSHNAIPVQTELTYTTDDIKWRAYYTGHLSHDQKHITASCWLVIQNQTHSLFPNMHLVLFDQNSGFYKAEQYNTHDHYNLNRYKIPHTVSLHPMKETRILWTKRNKIPIHKEYMIDLGGVFLTDLTNNDTALPKVDTQLSWENGDVNLPQGPMTIYQVNDLGHKSPLIQTIVTKARPKQRIGVMMPAHLKMNEQPPIDITFEQTDFQKYTSKYTESANRLTLTNNKDYPITVKVFINLPSEKSTIFRDSIHHKSEGDTHKYWIFELTPKQKINLLYRARIVN